VTSTRTELSILLIDDEEANLDLLEGLLASEGFNRTTRVSDARDVVKAFRECEADLVLLDLHMPFRNGFEVLADLRGCIPEGEYVPILVLTADVTSEARDRALSEGAHDFLTKPFDAVEVLLRVRNLLGTRRLHTSQRRARIRAQRAESRARLLAEASRAVASFLDREGPLAQVARLLEPTHVRSCVVLLRESDGYRVIQDRSAGPLGSSDGPDASSEPLASALLASRTTLVELPTTSDDAADSAPTLVVPMRIHSKTLGALLLHPRRQSGFSAADIAMFSDLADRVALAVHNAELFASAERATRDRDRMLSVVAHDLRNPLAVIAMYSEMLLGLLPPEEEGYAGEALSSIHMSSQRMQHQIEDLLDLSRLQGGSFVIQPSECVLEELFAEAELLLRPLAAKRSIELRFDGPAADPRGGSETVVRLDGARFQQVLANLVGNALKFAPEQGRVCVEWRIEGGELKVSVRDNGPGIPRDQLPHLFGAFWQARDADRRGIGLGLWIARAVVDGHRGRIWVDSVEGDGATFCFTIPLDGATLRIEMDASMGNLTHAPLPAAQ
jgi:signal transduction histidine kinase/CheY-like chemotaxis protein